MKKITARAVICLILAVFLALGVGWFVVKYYTQGHNWVSFKANDHIYSNGLPIAGAIVDRNGVVLASGADGSWYYHDSAAIRRATLHTVGDIEGMIGVGAMTRFADKLCGYNFVSGAAPVFKGGRRLYLTIDANLCQTAYEAMNGLKGTVGVYDYRSGKILCMVSTPTFDPADPPAISDDDNAYDGVYINRLLNATFIPGSTFKVITATAALETIPDIENQIYTCSGSTEIDGTTITCTAAHGEVTLKEALAQSCNCYFGELSLQLGASTLDKYSRRAGLTRQYSVNGIRTTASAFDFHGDAGQLAWSGIGQGKDLVNPCAMMVYMGAIANKGSAAVPQIIDHTASKDDFPLSLYTPRQTGDLIEAATAQRLTELMRNNVTGNYGQDNFPGLELCAKSGTAELDNSDANNAWFVGFLNDSDHPLAFVVYLEGGGYGSTAAGGVANRVLQKAIELGY